MRQLIAILFCFCALPASAVMDCSRARSNVEKMLCSSERAAGADQRLAMAFRGAFGRVADRDGLRLAQQQWQDNVRDRCADVPCLLKAFEERIADLDDMLK